MGTPATILAWERATHTGALYPAIYVDPPRHDSEAARRIVRSYAIAPEHAGLGLRILAALACYAPPVLAETADG